jgi:sugar lactone lactonase YvrE
MSALRGAAILLALFAAAIFPLSAQQLYITNEGHGDIQLWDINTNTLTSLYTIGVGADFNPDDLILNAAGQLIYSIPKTGNVNMYDPATGVNTTLATGIGAARDLEIEPGGASMLIAKYSGSPEIIRYNFASGAWSVLVSKTAKLGSCDGIAYDEYGNLYAVADHNTIIQINPSTGKILATLVLEPHSGINGGDGLTYDSYTKSLWATHDGTLGGGVLEIPVSPSGFASTSPGFTFYPMPGIGNLDGIKSDGKGNLYIGAIWTAIVYNIPTNTVTHSITVKGADGVSLVPGTY